MKVVNAYRTLNLQFHFFSKLSLAANAMPDSVNLATGIPSPETFPIVGASFKYVDGTELSVDQETMKSILPYQHPRAGLHNIRPARSFLQARENSVAENVAKARLRIITCPFRISSTLRRNRLLRPAASLCWSILPFQLSELCRPGLIQDSYPPTDEVNKRRVFAFICIKHHLWSFQRNLQHRPRRAL